MIEDRIKVLLNNKLDEFRQKHFIESDPISIPHFFSKKEDIEIAGFFAAILAWGLRKTILKNAFELMQRMDHAPFDFIKNHQDHDLQKLEGFVHRTFQDTDLFFFIQFFKEWYQNNTSLESLFVTKIHEETVESGLIQFHKTITQKDYFPARTRKHISTPITNSACKRLNMFLRWMVREDNQKIDFGIWKQIKSHQLICPCDVHVTKVAFHLKLVSQPNASWKQAVMLTQKLKMLDENDPVKYDFALFGIGLEMRKIELMK